MSTRLPLAGLLHLFVTYVVWGSTYLAIRMAVREGAGWGPFWLGGSRVVVAGAVLLAFSVLMRKRIRPTASEWWMIVVSGLLMWVGGNGGVNWAEQRVDSGLVALIVGTMPMWIAVAEARIERRVPSVFLVGAILTGFFGLGLLMLPLLREGMSGDLPGILVVIGATVCWGAGSLLLSHRPVGLDSTVTASLQLLTSAVGFSLFALVMSEPVPTPTPTAWGAWVYLVIFGSVISFTSYLKALKLLPTQVVMTYTYVNPVIAVFLGWFILDEPITLSMIGGMMMILAGVWGVFRDRHHRNFDLYRLKAPSSRVIPTQR
ncbi:MAG: EamA family transporter [Thermoanaerobaculales bacterium]|nr:EamA family transporter [Thermoanaerobaculales bacterium]